MLTAKENFMRTLNGDVPEYVSRYDLSWGTRPSILSGERVRGVGKDIYGVEYTNEGSAFEGALPKPGDFILDDVRKWRDVIKFPDFSGVDWEAMAQKDLANRNPDMPRGGGTAAGGFFQSLMAFMGFNEGLTACFTETEEVKALVNYLCDNYLSMAENFLKYYQPDYVSFGDDIAHERNPFVSLPMFRDTFAPVWSRYIGFFKERGYLAMHHNCGHFEELLDDLVDMGFNGWDPAQNSNDLVGIKQKFGNRLVICGGFDYSPFLHFMDATEEECREAVRSLLNDLAPGGGYAFIGGVLASDPISIQRTEWIQDEFEKIKFDYYK